ncbi:MAG: hypothetical protein HQK57_06675 [Deltaproteobacteria bacterium]|nr:hypothetical protein [Deltaproteobacteria bacterium]MBF0524127.1 hypothetical protein [Deltaproteobacteria bacterium]
MPPTTMSGFLKRLLLIADGKDWPGYDEDWFRPQDQSGEYTITLGREFRCLGAFPAHDQWTIHKTRRHGPKTTRHTEFSQIVRVIKSKTKKKTNDYQLHHWDYLFCDLLTGWVASYDREALEALQELKNFGGKAGKEGYVYVCRIDGPKEAWLKEGEFKPLGLVPQPCRPVSGTYYNLYGHHWNQDYTWTNGAKGGVDGYYQIGAWWNVATMAGPYWEMDDGVGFPASAPDAFLQGDVESVWGGGHEPLG